MLSRLAYAAATTTAVSTVLGRDQMDALAKQTEEMKSQLQRAEDNGTFQERKVKELSENLEHETTENRTLWDQVEYLTNELAKERDGRKRHVDLYRQEILKNQELNTLKTQLLQQVQDLQRTQSCMMSEANVTQRELETLTKEFNSLQSSHEDLCQAHVDIQEKYQMDISAKEEMTANLQKKLEMVKKICANRIKELKTELQKTKDDIDEQQLWDNDLAHKLESESANNRTLCEQVERLTKKLGREKEVKKELLRQVEEMKEKYDMDINTEKQRIVTLEEKLETMEKDNASKMSEQTQLLEQVQDLQRTQSCMMSEATVTQRELETVTREFNSLQSSHDDLCQAHVDIQEKYQMDISAKEEMTANLQKKLEMVKKICANRIKELKTELQKTKDDIDEQQLWDNDLAHKLESESANNRTLCEQVERLTKKLGREKEVKKELLRQVEEMKEKYDMDINTEKQRIVTLEEKLEMMEKDNASKMSEHDHLIHEHQKQVSKREIELEHLKILLHEQTSKNSELLVQLQTEKTLNGILHSELDTLKDQRTSSFSVSPNPEPVDEVSSHDSRNPGPVDDPSSVSQATENAVVTTRKPSLWKKTRHFLGLRKTNKQRNVRQQTESPSVSQDPKPLQESSFSVSQDSGVEHSPSTSEDTDMNAGAEGCDENAAVTTRKPSLWKQTGHFLGLRKKEKERNVQQQSPPVSTGPRTEVRRRQ
ncbi:hypothetical protein GBF38_016062 [Nibea albiflora]|uniref:Uncharacterized protein n=1 Tax=Nibea albiflora TaxID=240163 RepID=A0ACB7FHU9_NIBAL|nr:hypothetical protein GBF38_016062 [Nibea albiflora]